MRTTSIVINAETERNPVTVSAAPAEHACEGKLDPKV